MQVSIATLGIGAGALLAGLFGMNVSHGNTLHLVYVLNAFSLVDKPHGGTSFRLLWHVGGFCIRRSFRSVDGF
jgi:hypothetical protein